MTKKRTWTSQWWRVRESSRDDFRLLIAARPAAFNRFNSERVGVAVKPVGKPDARSRHVRLDKRVPNSTVDRVGRIHGLGGHGRFPHLAQTEGYERRAREAARTVATGVTLFQLERPEGIAFPGYDLFRITCDYGSGSAGVALFLNRLLTGRNADFLLDTLFEDKNEKVQECG